MDISTIKPLIAAPKDGEKGKDGISYYMIADRSSISADADGNSEDEDFYIYGYKINGNGIPKLVRNRIEVYLVSDNGNYIEDTTLPYWVCPPQLSSRIAEDDIQAFHIEMYEETGERVVAMLDEGVSK